MRKVFFIRHAKPEFPTEERYCCGGRSDWPLSEEGKEQCEKMRDSLLVFFKTEEAAGRKTEVWTSPLKRAVQTAEYLCREGVKPKIKEGLKELDAGLWDGLPFSEIRQKYPNEYAARENEQGMGFIPGAESDEHGLKRFTDAVLEIMCETEADNIVIVSHAAVIRLFLYERNRMEHKDAVPPKPGYVQVVCVEM